MELDTSWFRYKGDGSVPPEHEYDSRGERGRYLADPDLVVAVNTALTIEQPLLVVGESGTGKTMLAWSVASELGLLPVLEFHTRSDHRARDVLFVIDNLRRFYDATVRHERATNLENYVTWQPLGEAIRSPTQCVVLIDEIDKAPRDFPNDLLDEIDRMEFRFPELSPLPFRASQRPIVILTSNNERQLPEPFLRRCVFHRIEFPKDVELHAILRERLGHLQIDRNLIEAATRRFSALRDDALRLEKKPATGELLSWVRMLVKAGVDPKALAATPLRELPFLGTLLKNKGDFDAVRKSAA
jgi:MoxR-like ATPase